MSGISRSLHYLLKAALPAHTHTRTHALLKSFHIPLGEAHTGLSVIQTVNADY